MKRPLQKTLRSLGCIFKSTAKTQIHKKTRCPKQIHANSLFERDSPTPSECLKQMTKKRRRDGASSIDENGKVSNSLLHQQLTEGVDEMELQMQASQIMQDDLVLSKEEADEICGVTAAVEVKTRGG